MKRKVILPALLLLIAASLSAQDFFTITKERLKDKIKGGWAGQTIGVTYGAPVEFQYNGTLINEYKKIPWYDGLLKKTMTDNPGVYDDLYMDLTFVEVFQREGLDAPVSSHANAFAKAGYMLWHANQAARYNILKGIPAPSSGHWQNNPHADCIDYQIESDFAGLMSPAMPNTASAISDKIGHIMNYGDGWYGGVYIGAMYALAFRYDNIGFIVSEALRTIPTNTNYYRCISDVIAWHKKYPKDWKQTWFEVQKKWSDDKGCPDGVYSPFNIDATVNSAYVVIGLLYGNGDYTKTIEIATRCGQDADCNPSSAAGILGTMLGYSKIPAYWKQGLVAIEDMDFKYTTTSLNDVYENGTAQALANIERNGGKLQGEKIMILTQKPVPVKWEQSFDKLEPYEKKWGGTILNNDYEFSFTGKGFVVKGEVRPLTGSAWDSKSDNYLEMEVYIDGQLTEKVKLPVRFTTRRHELCWNYKLDDKAHVVRLKLVKAEPEMNAHITELIFYK